MRRTSRTGSRFQSTLPRGSDCSIVLRTVMLMNFNPRSLAGATVLCPRAAIAWADFNPRSLTGATGRGNGFSKSFTISIHAPSRERHFVLMYLGEFDEFQSTLPHGSDAILLLISSLLLIFQSTLPHGSDTCANSSAGRGHKFQSTLPHGSDTVLTAEM